ncbi:MAG: response regulator [Deltaproteobacteria bacterium]|nr:response regulator [Deltaproteobacteria bacterium]
MRMLLEARQHHVMDAGDGETAIALIERERPDIAFIDIGMPRMNGYEVAQRIRLDRSLPARADHRRHGQRPMSVIRAR